eukprot:989881-Rhodomonas_salina.1
MGSLGVVDMSDRLRDCILCCTLGRRELTECSILEVEPYAKMNGSRVRELTTALRPWSESGCKQQARRRISEARIFAHRCELHWIESSYPESIT